MWFISWLRFSSHLARKVWILTLPLDSFWDFCDFAYLVGSSLPSQCKEKIKGSNSGMLWVLAIKTEHESCLQRENITLPFNERIRLSPSSSISSLNLLMSYRKEEMKSGLPEARAKGISTRIMVYELKYSNLVADLIPSQDT